MRETSVPVPDRGAWAQRLQRARSRVLAMAPFASGVLAALAALLIYNALFPGPQPLTQNQVNDTVAQVMSSATPAPAYSASVYQAILPSLVLIQTNGPVIGEEGSALGSGVVINDSGDILTSLHVVENAVSIQLTFADGSQVPAEVVAAQPENDIAVLHPLEAPGLIVPATLGNPHAMRIGDEAYAVGNPFGLYGSMSVGVISGFNRSFEHSESDQKLEGLIQIDAAVNPGNSGGPLLNRQGQVVGIIVGLVNPSGQDFFIGIGFAVPITTAGGAAGMPPY
jgi:S1-C subfamily serine protease